MSVPVSAITSERLELWRADCVRDHATPLMLIAVGHDHVSGELHVYIPEDLPNEDELATLLVDIARRLKGGYAF